MKLKLILEVVKSIEVEINILAQNSTITESAKEYFYISRSKVNEKLTI